MKLTTNFNLQEFVPDHLYKHYGIQSVRYLDSRIVTLAQQIRTHFGRPMTINNKWAGGSYNYRGLRPSHGLIDTYSDTIKRFGSPSSQHAYGRAIDFHFDGIDTDEVRELLIAKRDTEFPLLMGIEMKVSWIHADVRYRPGGALLLFDPPK